MCFHRRRGKPADSGALLASPSRLPLSSVSSVFRQYLSLGFRATTMVLIRRKKRMIKNIFGKERVLWGVSPLGRRETPSSRSPAGILPSELAFYHWFFAHLRDGYYDVEKGMGRSENDQKKRRYANWKNPAFLTFTCLPGNTVRRRTRPGVISPYTQKVAPNPVRWNGVVSPTTSCQTG